MKCDYPCKNRDINSLKGKMILENATTVNGGYTLISRYFMVLIFRHIVCILIPWHKVLESFLLLSAL
jgi:hypothetical protein